MKKFLGIAVVCALCGVIAGCGDTPVGNDNGNPDDIIIVADTNVPDDVVVNPDADRDDQVPVDTNVNPDTNVDPDTNVNPDTNVDPDEGQPPVDCYTGSCMQYWDCYGECPTGAEQDACVAECQSALSAQGQSDLEVFNQCLYTTCGGMADEEAWYACIDENCTEAIVGCYWGCVYETCDQMYGCYDGCPEDDAGTTVDENTECIYDCRYDSSKEAQMDQQAMYDCAFEECPICDTAETDAEWEQCDACFNDAVMGACWNDYKKCVSSGTEYMTCRDFSICFTACQYSAETQEQYDTCVDGCQAGVDAEALHDRILAENCSIDACPICNTAETAEENAQCNECWNGTIYGNGTTAGVCEAEWTICIFGTEYTTCQDMYSCMAGAADYNEYVTCQFNANIDARGDYEAARACSIDACPICTTGTTAADETACNDCFEASISGACATEWNVCLPEPGTDSCRVVWDCINACTVESCPQECFNGGDTDAQNMFIDMQDCWETNCGTLSGQAWSDCVNTAINAGGACETEFNACYNDIDA